MSTASEFLAAGELLRDGLLSTAGDFSGDF